MPTPFETPLPVEALPQQNRAKKPVAQNGQATRGIGAVAATGSGEGGRVKQPNSARAGAPTEVEAGAAAETAAPANAHTPADAHAHANHDELLDLPVIKGRRITVYEVAKLAEVSPGTVSRVLNNRGRVHAETGKRVFEAARSLGFRPQVQVRTKQVAVISENIGKYLRNWGYYQIVWSHTAFALNKHEMAMIVPDSLAELGQKHVDGIIVVGAYPEARPLLAELRKHIPIVMTDDFSVAADPYTVVGSNYRMAGKLAAECFIQGGRRSLGYVGPWSPRENSTLGGYKEAMAAAGVECRDELIALRSEKENFYSAVSRIVRHGADAIFIPGSNFEAMEGMNVLSNVLRLQIPKDIALIGGEIHGVSAYTVPPMTTIEDPLAEVANHAVETLAAMMRGERPPREQVLPVKLIARESA